MEELETYLSDLLDDLKSFASLTMEEGFLGLSVATQDDIMNLSNERDFQQLFEKKDVLAGGGAMGNWSLPDSVLASASGSAEIAFTQTRYDRSAEIRKKALEIALKRMRFAVDQGVIIEQALQMYTLLIQKIKAAVYNAEVEVFAAKIEATAVQFKVETDKYAAQIAEYEAAVTTDTTNYNLANEVNKVNSKNFDPAITGFFSTD